MLADLYLFSISVEPAFSEMASFLPVGGKQGEFTCVQDELREKRLFSFIIRIYLASFAWKAFFFFLSKVCSILSLTKICL